MTQSIAFLVGNTRYEKLVDLPCSANDVSNMYNLLDAREKFTQIRKFVGIPISQATEILRELTEAENGVDEVSLYGSVRELCACPFCH